MINIIIISLLALSSCSVVFKGDISRFRVGKEGCVDGVKYIYFEGGYGGNIAVKYDRHGKVVTCDPKNKK